MKAMIDPTMPVIPTQIVTFDRKLGLYGPFVDAIFFSWIIHFNLELVNFIISFQYEHFTFKAQNQM